jgi:hypothetical protein
MNIEERLSEALHQEAENREVDLHALYAPTRARLDDDAKRTGRRRHRPGLLVAAVVAGVLAVGGGAAVLDDGLRGRLGFITGELVEHEPAREAPVDDTFTCPHQLTATGFGTPEIFGDGPDFGVGAFGAERFEFIPRGQRAVLQVGTADGTLTSRVQLRNHQGSWVLDSYERCTGPNGSEVPVQGRFELGAHGREIPQAPRPLSESKPYLGGGPPTSSIVALDDRPMYNRVGIVEWRTIYAYETRNGLTFMDVLDGQETGGTPTDIGDPPRNWFGQGFIPAYESKEQMRGWNVFGGWAYYSTEPATLTARLKDGSAVEAKRYRGDDWQGTLHALLVPADQIDVVVLERDGQRKTFKPDPAP